MMVSVVAEMMPRWSPGPDQAMETGRLGTSAFHCHRIETSRAARRGPGVGMKLTVAYTDTASCIAAVLVPEPGCRAGCARVAAGSARLSACTIAIVQAALPAAPPWLHLSGMKLLVVLALATGTLFGDVGRGPAELSHEPVARGAGVGSSAMRQCNGSAAELVDPWGAGSSEISDPWLETRSVEAARAELPQPWPALPYRQMRSELVDPWPGAIRHRPAPEVGEPWSSAPGDEIAPMPELVDPWPADRRQVGELEVARPWPETRGYAAAQEVVNPWPPESAD